MKDMMIKTFAFDLGRVIFDFDYNIALEKMVGQITASKEKIIDELFYKDFGTDFEKGLISSREFYLKFKKEFGGAPIYEEFADIWCDIFSLNEKVKDLISKLSKTYSVYLISNINELHFEFLYTRHPDIFNLFNGLILSYQVQAVKPEKLIYETLKNLANTAYENIIYIDDRQDLIEEAKQLKLRCIQFTDFDRLVSNLRSLNITVQD